MYDPFVADDTLLCDWKFEHTNHITMHVVFNIFYNPKALAS